MENNEDIKEAKKELDEISKDDVLRRIALKAELERMDTNQRIEDAINRGKAEGIEEGMKQVSIQVYLRMRYALLMEQQYVELHLLKKMG